MTTTIRGEPKNETAPIADATPANDVSRPSSHDVLEPSGSSSVVMARAASRASSRSGP